MPGVALCTSRRNVAVRMAIQTLQPTHNGAACNIYTLSHTHTKVQTRVMRIRLMAPILTYQQAHTSLRVDTARLSFGTPASMSRQRDEFEAATTRVLHLFQVNVECRVYYICRASAVWIHLPCCHVTRARTRCPWSKLSLCSTQRIYPCACLVLRGAEGRPHINLVHQHVRGGEQEVAHAGVVGVQGPHGHSLVRCTGKRVLPHAPHVAFRADNRDRPRVQHLNAEEDPAFSKRVK